VRGVVAPGPRIIGVSGVVRLLGFELERPGSENWPSIALTIIYHVLPPESEVWQGYFLQLGWLAASVDALIRYTRVSCL
jgi:hypothetical protein